MKYVLVGIFLMNSAFAFDFDSSNRRGNYEYHDQNIYEAFAMAALFLCQKDDPDSSLHIENDRNTVKFKCVSTHEGQQEIKDES